MRSLAKSTIGRCWACDEELTLLTAYDQTVTGYVCAQCAAQSYLIHKLLEHIPGIRHPKPMELDGQDQ